MTFSVAVAGASGYAGGELLRLLADHPDFEVPTVTAHANAGQPLVAVHPHLRSLAHLTLQETTAEMLSGHDVVFLALPHGQSGAITAAARPETLVIDCGADHRLESSGDWAAFYGGDFHGAWTLRRARAAARWRARSATGSPGPRRIAAPGCNATTVTLALAPGIAAGVIEAATSSRCSPSARRARARAWRTCSRARSSVPRTRTRSAACTGTSPRSCRPCGGRGRPAPTISFTPVLVPMSRGILATSTARSCPARMPRPCARPGRTPTPTSRSCTCCPRASSRARPTCSGANTALIGLAVDEAAGPRRRGHRRRQPRQGHRGRRHPVRQHRARPRRVDRPSRERSRPVTVTAPAGFDAAGVAAGIKRRARSTSPSS